MRATARDLRQGSLMAPKRPSAAIRRAGKGRYVAETAAGVNLAMIAANSFKKM